MPERGEGQTVRPASPRARPPLPVCRWSQEGGGDVLDVLCSLSCTAVLAGPSPLSLALLHKAWLSRSGTSRACCRLELDQGQRLRQKAVREGALLVRSAARRASLTRQWPSRFVLWLPYSTAPATKNCTIQIRERRPLVRPPPLAPSSFNTSDARLRREKIPNRSS